MSTKNEPQVNDPKVTTTDAPQPENEVEEKDKSQVGRVQIPEGTQVNMVPASDGKGGMVMVPADEPGHPDVTTSPLETSTQPEAKSKTSS